MQTDHGIVGRDFLDCARHCQPGMGTKVVPVSTEMISYNNGLDILIRLKPTLPRGTLYTQLRLKTSRQTPSRLSVQMSG